MEGMRDCDTVRNIPWQLDLWDWLDTGLASWVDSWRTAEKWPAGFLPVRNLMCPRLGPFSPVLLP